MFCELMYKKLPQCTYGREGYPPPPPSPRKSGTTPTEAPSSVALPQQNGVEEYSESDSDNEESDLDSSFEEDEEEEEEEHPQSVPVATKHFSPHPLSPKSLSSPTKPKASVIKGPARSMVTAVLGDHAYFSPSSSN